MAEVLPAPFDRPDQGFNSLPGWTWIGTYGGYFLQADLRVALGPAVAGARYQVHHSVSRQVAASLEPPSTTPVDALLHHLQELGAIAPDSEPGHDRLDIRLAAWAQLLRSGLAAEQIAICPLCTVQEPLLFHSWRRDQVKAVQWSGIVAQAES